MKEKERATKEKEKENKRRNEEGERDKDRWWVGFRHLATPNKTSQSLKISASMVVR